MLEAVLVCPSPSAKAYRGSPSVEIVLRPKEHVPLLKRCCLVRLGDASPSSIPPPADEPVVQSKIVKSSSSDATSQEPSIDKELPLVVRDVPGPSRRATCCEDAIPDGGPSMILLLRTFERRFLLLI